MSPTDYVLTVLSNVGLLVLFVAAVAVLRALVAQLTGRSRAIFLGVLLFIGVVTKEVLSNVEIDIYMSIRPVFLMLAGMLILAMVAVHQVTGAGRRATSDGGLLQALCWVGYAVILWFWVQTFESLSAQARAGIYVALAYLVGFGLLALGAVVAAMALLARGSGVRSAQAPAGPPSTESEAPHSGNGEPGQQATRRQMQVAYLVIGLVCVLGGAHNLFFYSTSDVKDLAQSRAVGVVVLIGGALILVIGLVGLLKGRRRYLLDAAYDGDTQAIDALVARGADVNARFREGITALLAAAYEGHAETVRALLAHGAAVDASQADGVTPLAIAALRGHGDVVTALLAGGAAIDGGATDGSTPLMVAARAGHRDVVRMLLGGGASVDARDESGATALMWAALDGQTEAARVLLDRGADIDARDADGRTALMHAARKCRGETVRVLLDSGADCGAADKYGWTAFMFWGAEYCDTDSEIAHLLGRQDQPA